MKATFSFHLSLVIGLHFHCCFSLKIQVNLSSIYVSSIIYLSCIYQTSIYLSKYTFIIMHHYPYLYCLYIMSFLGCSKDDPIHTAKTLRLLRILLLSFLFSDTHSTLFIHSLIRWFNKSLSKRDDVPDTHCSYDRNERRTEGKYSFSSMSMRRSIQQVSSPAMRTWLKYFN